MKCSSNLIVQYYRLLDAVDLSSKIYGIPNFNKLSNKFWNGFDDYCQEFRECLGFVTTKGSEDSSDKLNQ